MLIREEFFQALDDQQQALVGVLGLEDKSFISVLPLGRRALGRRNVQSVFLEIQNHLERITHALGQFQILGTMTFAAPALGQFVLVENPAISG